MSSPDIDDPDTVVDFDVLETRAAKHKRLLDAEPQPPKPLKKSSRLNIIKCQKHEDNKKDSWTSTNSDCKLCVRFGICEDLNDSVLPRILDMVNLILTLKSENNGQFGMHVYGECAELICLTWVNCNVYPLPLSTVKRRIEGLFLEYRGIKKYSSKSAAYWAKCTPFLEKMTELFDIPAGDNLKTAWQKKTGVKNDKEFYDKQKQNPPLGYSTAKVDKVWEKNAKRKEKLAKRSTKEDSSSTTPADIVDFEFENDDDELVFDDDYVPDENPTKKRKYEFKEIIEDEEEDDDLPFVYRYLRSSLHTVRSEVYKLIALLKSRFHMSQTQAEAAIVYVANMLFKRKWKFYDPEKPTDKNTLPAGSNMRRVEPYLEAMALASIVEEIMTGKKLVVTYSNNGSAMSGVGNCVVQSFTINNVQRTLPTFSIFTETRESLQELEKMTLKILCAAVGYRYTEQDILSNIDFVMTDSTSHNLLVMEGVCDEYDVKHPKALVCNIHPLMMMQKKVKEVFRMLHDTIGLDKVKECFLSDVDFANDDFITKAICCLTNFINKDHSAKPWNRNSHFDNYIKPRKNMSITLKDHRFNRVFSCCEGLVYHIDDIAGYFDKYRNIVNGISIIDRSFVEMPILKPIFCAVALIGVHITKPFQALLIDVDTKYSTLTVAFPKLYEELTTAEAVDMCTTSIQAFHFVSKEIFSSCSPDKAVCEVIDACAKTYNSQVVALMKMITSKIADGFDLQRGAIFGFGTHADDDTGSLLKIADATDEEKEELELTTVHNLAEERSVGSLNNELKIRGKRNLESASRKLVLNKSFDLIEKKNPKEYLNVRKPAQDIANLKNEWHEKMKLLEDESFADKDHVNMHLDTVKYKDLEFLKERGGPFVSAEEVEAYMVQNEIGDKNQRLYVEVRYAKNTSLRLKHTDPVFRLKRDGKNLSNEEYAANLVSFLGSARKTSTISCDDLKNAISKLTGSNIIPLKSKDLSTHDTTEGEKLSHSTFKPGEHVVIFWIDKANDVVWYLGIVDDVVDDKIKVLHLKQTDKNGQRWVIPDNPEVIPVDEDQILDRNVRVIYHGVSCRIELSKAKKNEIISLVDKVKQHFN